MKKIQLTLTFVFLLIISAACTKEDSKISGQVTYIGAISGIEYYGNGASVSLFMGGTNTPYETVTADAQGNYSFSGLAEGSWSVVATTTVNLINYEGAAVAFVDGKESKTINIVMN